jgi:putative DNA methylase
MTEALQSVLRHLDQEAVSVSARAETRSREIYLPPVSIYRWWARRTEAVNGALLDATAKELGRGEPLLVADPFAGGGVIPLAVLKRGHRVYAQDLNPWVGAGLSTMLGLPSTKRLLGAGERLLQRCEDLAAKAYSTTFADGQQAQIIHALRVAVSNCSHCGAIDKLYPHALVSRTKRKERGGLEAFLACRNGHLFRSDATGYPICPECAVDVDPQDTYLPGRIATCSSCDGQDSLEVRAKGWTWEVVLVERSDGVRRELAHPTQAEIEAASDAAWHPRRKLGAIPQSPETRVLWRHGFRSWAEIYPARQRYIMERLLQLCRAMDFESDIQRALEMAVLGTAEMAGLLSRWDRHYLKSYESMASHRFNFTTLAVETNIIGVGRHGRGTLRRRLELFGRAARWLQDHGIITERPTFRYSNESRPNTDPKRRAMVVAGSSEHLLLPDRSVDVVLTDPPYHDDVQYHELSLPFRAWANLTRVRLLGEAVAIPHSTSLLGHRQYRGTLLRIFQELHRVLKTDGRLLFSYANREPAAWVNLFAALRASGFQPMGYSIVHSENESDHAKRKGRACNLDLILELAPAGAKVRERWRAKPLFETDEERFLMAVGDAFLQSGEMVNGWEVELVERLKSEIFVSAYVSTSSEMTVMRQLLSAGQTGALNPA